MTAGRSLAARPGSRDGEEPVHAPWTARGPKTTRTNLYGRRTCPVRMVTPVELAMT
jgi:hypothetical protein